MLVGVDSTQLRNTIRVHSQLQDRPTMRRRMSQDDRHARDCLLQGGPFTISNCKKEELHRMIIVPSLRFESNLVLFIPVTLR